MKEDIRWKQRFANYKKALGQLTKFIDRGNLNELEKQGLIKSFEYTYELAWNTIRDFLLYQGRSSIVGSRDAIRYAFKDELIEKGEVWIEMIKSRNKTSHTYNEMILEGVVEDIVNVYFPLLEDFSIQMQKRCDSD